MYALGLDFGTGSARALIASTRDGREVGLGVAAYEHGDEGVVTDSREPLLARQHPADWLLALELAVRRALDAARAKEPSFSSDAIVGIGIDATASTPLPVGTDLGPLAAMERFHGDPAALAWLWKDHTAHAEAEEITRVAARMRPHYLAKCGGAYSSEWYFSKLLRALRTAPGVLAAADGWVEEGDFIAGVLSGARSPRELRRNTCAASHKALYHRAWGGFPDLEFLREVDPRLAEWCRGRLPGRAHAADEAAGALCDEWARRLGLPAGTPVAVAAIDAHSGAVGAGIRPGVLVKIIGTSACDMLVHPLDEPLADIPGICGIAESSIVPGSLGLEAGQAAVGDVFAWFVRAMGGRAGSASGFTHEALTEDAARLRPGESGLLALDWHNGNRCVLADPLLSGLVVGLTLGTKPHEIYRALIEATAFGARTILERFERHGVRVNEVIACGGIAERSPFLLQTYADVLGRPIQVSRSSETCALGAAIFGAVAGGRAGRAGGWASMPEAARAMTGTRKGVHSPDGGARAVHDRLFRLYGALHDAFGGTGPVPLGEVMKELFRIRDGARAR